MKNCRLPVCVGFILLFLPITLSSQTIHHAVNSPYLQPQNGTVIGRPNVRFHLAQNFSITRASTDSLQLAWTRNYASQQAAGRDAPVGVVTDAPGNIYIAGNSTRLPYGNNIVLVKYDPNGSEQSVIRYNSGEDVVAQAIAIDGEGNIIIGGTINPLSSHPEFLVLKYSSGGDLHWSQRGTGNADLAKLEGLHVHVDGSIYATGESGVNNDFFAIKLDRNGNRLWATNHSENSEIMLLPRVTMLDRAGNLYVTGRRYPSYQYSSFETAKYASDGMLQWIRSFARPGYNFGYFNAIAVDSSGNVLVTGTLKDSTEAETINTIKYSPAGEQLWVAEYAAGAEKRIEVSAMACDKNGNVYVAGGDDKLEMVVIQYDSSGAQKWLHSTAEQGYPFPAVKKMAINEAGFLHIVGKTRVDNQNKTALAKFDLSGEKLWMQQYDGLAAARNEYVGLALDPLGNSIITGTSGLSDNAIATFKYSAGGDEQWIAQYDGPGSSQDRMERVLSDASGDVYLISQSDRKDSGRGILVAKYDAHGNALWQTFHKGRGAGYDDLKDAEIDQAGNLYLSCSNDGFDGVYDRDWMILKMNAAGEVLWVNYFSSTVDILASPGGILVDKFGNVYVSGIAYFEWEGERQYVVIKYSPDGVQQWQKLTENLPFRTQALISLTFDDQEDMIFLYSTFRQDLTGGFTLVKWSTDGQLKWQKYFDGEPALQDVPLSMTIDHSGNALVVGEQYENFTRSERKPFISKISSDGRVLWSRTFFVDGADYASALSVFADRKGHARVVGLAASDATGYSYFVANYNRKGEQLWLYEQFHGGRESFPSTRAYGVDANDHVYIMGVLDTRGAYTGMYIHKIFADGTGSWRNNTDGPMAETFAFDPFGNILVGSTLQGAGWTTAVVSKYIQNELTGFDVPETFVLAQNYPNPFNYATTIRYDVPVRSHVSLKIYDIRGREVTTLADGVHVVGRHQVIWGGADESSGVYFYRLEGNGFSEIRKLVLVK